MAELKPIFQVLVLAGQLAIFLKVEQRWIQAVLVAMAAAQLYRKFFRSPASEA